MGDRPDGGRVARWDADTALLGQGEALAGGIGRLEGRVTPERAKRNRFAAELAHRSLGSFATAAGKERARRGILKRQKTD